MQLPPVKQVPQCSSMGRELLTLAARTSPSPMTQQLAQLFNSHRPVGATSHNPIGRQCINTPPTTAMHKPAALCAKARSSMRCCQPQHSTAQHLHNGVSRPDVCQELVAQALSSRCALDQTCHIHELKRGGHLHEQVAGGQVAGVLLTASCGPMHSCSWALTTFWRPNPRFKVGCGQARRTAPPPAQPSSIHGTNRGMQASGLGTACNLDPPPLPERELQHLVLPPAPNPPQ